MLILLCWCGLVVLAVGNIVLVTRNTRTALRCHRLRHALEAERDRQRYGIVILTIHELDAANTVPVAFQRRGHFFLN